jgi:Lon protease-like protein
MRGSFIPSLDSLPDVVPVFAVPGAILLPGGHLPLIVFEPRYLALVEDCLGAGRLFGLVQPHEGVTEPVPGLHPVGTLARISAFGETGDGRYLITATGLCRFQLVGERDGRAGYRRIAADYTPFAEDLGPRTVTLPERDRLMSLVRARLADLGLDTDIDALGVLPDGEFTDRVAMVCPFPAEDKQIQLEAMTPAERCRLMIGIIQRELLDRGGNSTLH